MLPVFRVRQAGWNPVPNAFPGLFVLQNQHRARRYFLLQISQPMDQVLGAALEVRKGGTQKDSDRFVRRFPTCDPTVNIGALDGRLIGNPESLQVAYDRGGSLNIPFHQGDRSRAAAERL